MKKNAKTKFKHAILPAAGGENGVKINFYLK